MLGLTVDLVPDTHTGEALAAELLRMPGKRLLLPQADLAPATLRDQLAAAGLEVTALAAYRTVMGQGGVDLPALLRAGQVDAITFTSGSTVSNCLARLEAEGGSPDLLDAILIACIGPSTAKVAKSAGLSHDPRARRLHAGRIGRRAGRSAPLSLMRA